MAETNKIATEKRSETGTLRMRRLRQTGQIPAVLYGHGKENIPLMVSAKDVGSAINSGLRIVELTGVVAESAMIKDVQWDPIGMDEVLHLDFARVSADEMLEVNVLLDIKGSAVGEKQGGSVTKAIRRLKISCPANLIPESLIIDINELQLNEAILASSIELPAGATLITDPGTTIVSCAVVEQREEADGDDGDTPAEPEVIGQKKEDEGGDDA